MGTLVGVVERSIHIHGRHKDNPPNPRGRDDRDHSDKAARYAAASDRIRHTARLALTARSASRQPVPARRSRTRGMPSLVRVQRQVVV